MKENKTHASTSRYHSLKAMISLLPLCAALLSISCGTASHGNKTTTDRKLYSLIKDDPYEEGKSFELLYTNGKITKITVWGTNDLFDNDRNGKRAPVYFVDTLTITAQRSDSIFGMLDARRITFLNDSVPTTIHTTEEAIKSGIPKVSIDEAYIWFDSTSIFRITFKDKIFDNDTLVVDNKYYDVYNLYKRVK